jgi:N-acetylglucosamine transport system substrate-binding protein
MTKEDFLMKNWIPKFFALLTASSIVALLLMTGCTSPTSAPETIAPTTSASTETTTAPTTVPTADPNRLELKGTFEIAAFTNGEESDKYWNEAIAGFQKAYPDLVIKSTITGSIGDTLRPRWVQNDVPDFAYLDGESVVNDLPTLLDENRFMQLNDWLAGAKSWNDVNVPLLDTWSDKTAGRLDSEGKVIALCNGGYTFGLFYSNKLAKSLGVADMISPTMSYEDFIAVCDKIKANGSAAAIGYPGQNALSYLTEYWIDPMLASTDPQTLIDLGNFYNDITVFDRPSLRDSYNLMINLRQYEMSGCIALKHTEVQIAWCQGKVLFYPTGSWIEGEMAKDVPADFDMKFLPFPQPAKGTGNYVKLSMQGNWFIPKDAKNPDAAKEFVRYLYSQEMAKKYMESYKTTFLVPVKDTSGTTMTPMIESINSVFSNPAVKHYLAKYDWYHFAYEYPVLATYYSQTEMKAFAGVITVDAFIDGWKAEAQKLMSDPAFVKLEQKWLIAP